MEDACDLAGVALVKTVEVALDHALDEFDVVVRGHGKKSSLNDRAVDIAIPAANTNEFIERLTQKF
jgi:hypothetical protein